MFKENLMRKMGFCEQWIGLIMVCVCENSHQLYTSEQRTKGFDPPLKGP